MYSVYFNGQYVGNMSVNTDSPLKSFLAANSEFKGMASQLKFKKL